MRPSGLIRTFAYAAAHSFLSRTENIIVGIVDGYSFNSVRLKRLRYLILVSHKKCAFVTGGRLRRTREISRESELISGVSNITHAYAPPSEERHSPVRYRSARKLADEELRRAIQLSLEEVGAANVNGRPGYTPSQPDPSAYSKWRTSEPPPVDRSSQPRAADDGENDPDLRAAIEASLREANAPKARAPASVESPVVETSGQSYTSSSYTAPARPCCQCSSKL